MHQTRSSNPDAALCGKFAPASTKCRTAAQEAKRDRMGIAAKVDQDLVAAMKARDELRLSVLRMTKTALKLKQVELGRTLEESCVAQHTGHK